MAGKLFLIFGLSAIKTVLSFGSSLLSYFGSKNSSLIYFNINLSKDGTSFGYSYSKIPTDLKST